MRGLAKGRGLGPIVRCKTGYPNMKLLVSAAVASVAFAFAMPAAAAVVLTAPVYSQDFDTLATTGTSSTLPLGWSINETSANANGLYTAGTGSSATGDTYSFGASGSSERALGGVSSENLIPSYGVQITNGLGGPITALSISYFGELWRSGNALASPDGLVFAYSLDATSLSSGTFTNFSALDFNVTPAGSTGLRDGNAAANRTAISSSLSGFSLGIGQSIFLRWTDPDVFRADHGLAIDDVQITATFQQTPAVPEPGTWAMLIAGFGLVGGTLRRRRVLERVINAA